MWRSTVPYLAEVSWPAVSETIGTLLISRALALNGSSAP